jgi:hypothetical protein
MLRVCRLGGFICLFALLGVYANAWDSSENEVHFTAKIQTSLTKKIGFKLTEEWRTKKGFDADSDYDSIYYHTEIAFPLKYVSWVTLEPDFRLVRVRTKSGWETDYLFHFNIGKTFKLNSDFSLKTRLRFCLNDKDSKAESHFMQNAWEIRPLIWLNYTHWKKVVPFFAYEYFYNSSDGFHYRNRYYLGVVYKLNKAWSFKTDIIKQDDCAFNKSNWKERFIMRFAANYKF